MCSVVVPTYGRAGRLGPLLQSLHAIVDRGAEQGEPVEVVVIDDGSPDETPSLLTSSPWLTSERQENAGAAAARNRGWRQASSDLIVFIDDDCIPTEGWPWDLLAHFEDETVGGVGGAIVSRSNGTMDRFIEVERLVDHGRDLGDTADYLVTANAAYRRSVLQEAGGFDAEFPGAAGEDVDLAWRVRAAGWRLVRSSCAVEHHQRSSLRDILSTYRKHGRSRVLLDRRHRFQGAGGSALKAVQPSELVSRWRAYRDSGCGRLRTLGFIVLRFAGLLTYAVAIVSERRSG